MYKTTFFKPQELVSKWLFDNINRDIIFQLFDNRLLLTIDYLRTRYGKMVINNWSTGGNLNDCGFRDSNSKTGTIFSQHRYGRAIDLHPTETTVDLIRSDIINKKYPDTFKYITCIEMDVSWLHIDCRNHSVLNNDIKLIYG